MKNICVHREQPLNKKAFTLIELLAVIVILAIITLIATPIILDVINDTKKESTRVSVQNYMDAVELTIAHQHMQDDKVLITGTYEIIEDGKYIKSVDNPEQTKLKVEYTGEGLTKGTVKLIDGQVREATEAKINKYYVKIILGEVKLFNKEIKKVELTTGGNFNSKIKTLVSGTEASRDTVDTKVRSIEFLSYGKLPKGYKLEDFQKLERVDISNQGDETIYAIYDGNDKVYIYTEDEIVFNKSSNHMFQNFQSVEAIDFEVYIDTSQVIDMNSMFVSCSSLTSLDLNCFDTSNVTNMYRMFRDCSSLINIIFGNQFNTSKVTNMGEMFSSCSELTSLDLSGFHTSSVTAMGQMFWICDKLETITLSSNFSTENVRIMTRMFDGCSSLKKLDLTSFNTSQVTTMNYMFQGCSSLTALDLSNFNTMLVNDMNSMFKDCSSLTNLIFGENFKTNIVTNMHGMFSNCSSLTSIDLSGFDTGLVSKMSSMFNGCSSLTSLDLSGFDTVLVNNMNSMFVGCTSLTSLIFGENFKTNIVTDMYGMFSNCKGLTSLDLSGFDTSKVTNMSSMFNGCSGLTSLDISTFSTSGVTNMVFMFRGMTNLTKILVGSGWDTTNADIGNMFNKCGVSAVTLKQ